MVRFTVIDAPSTLGLTVTGVEALPDALKSAGLMKELQAGYAGQVYIPQRESRIDAATLLLNPHSIRNFSLYLADKVMDVLRKDSFPVVLGGDCSILIGCMLALRRLGNYGLFFIDGHADFYQPEAEPNGEVASMELAFVSGRGPDILSNIDRYKPLVHDENIIAFGYRDIADQKKYGSQDICKSSINTFPLRQVEQIGCINAVHQAIGNLQIKKIDGFWIHLDADVLNDAIMPAVDYRLPGGLQWDELSGVIGALMATGAAVGITIAIYNPKLDPDGTIADKFTKCITAGLLAKPPDVSSYPDE